MKEVFVGGIAAVLVTALVMGGVVSCTVNNKAYYKQHYLTERMCIDKGGTLQNNPNGYEVICVQ